MSWWSKIKEKLGLAALLDNMIPEHANSPAYVIGGTILIMGLIQGITGVILQQFYDPSPEVAYISVQYITMDPVLNFLRNLHYWGAELIPLMLVLHMIRIYISASYKKPRESLWVSGVLLLAFVWLIAFTGTVLRWDQEGGEALAHAVEMAGLAGPLGSYFTSSFTPNVPVLVRISSLHTTIIPLTLGLLVGLHVYLIRTLGISSPKLSKTSVDTEAETVPFSTHIKRMILYGLVAFAVVAILAVLIQAPLSSVANASIEVSKPDWLMLWAYSIENFMGLQTLPYVATAVLVVMLIVPLLDRGEETDPRKRKLMMALLLIGVIIFALLTINGALSPPVSHLD